MRPHFILCAFIGCVFFPFETAECRVGGFGFYIYRAPPTSSPTNSPSYSYQPSPAPSMKPTYQPSGHPSIPSSSQPSFKPSSQPSVPTTNQPTSSKISSSFLKTETGSYTSGFWFMIALVSVLLCFLLLKFVLKI